MLVKPERRRRRGGPADPQTPSCENRQYVQTERTSPTPRVPRRFPSRVSCRARRAGAVAVPMRLSTPPDPAMLLRNTCATWVSYHFSAGGYRQARCGNASEQNVEFHWSGLRDGIAVMSPSPRTHL